MNKRSSSGLLLCTCLAAALAGGCTTRPGQVGTMGAGGAAGGTVPLAVAGRLSTAERDFAARAVARGMYEIEVSKLAAERAINRGVRSYARALAGHHAQANGELIALMSARGVAAPRGLAADRVEKLQRLASLPPSAAFDQGYVRVVGVEDHRTNIALFERARRDARDPALRAWIDRMLAAMRNQLTTAQNLFDTLAG